ncbi:EML1 [Cordylochernes scorpioides]|uniref:EML1 n=1 Tax=Cordylochernes scorpioides TaxID=51811 RepID=A0ABY6LBX3_9ARAC|nr:EML1 [Cordylochernes scorpioides]
MESSLSFSQYETPTEANKDAESGSGGGDSMGCVEDRIAELEKKVQDQADEIVCLRSTLADVLRRVNQMEGRAPVITTNHVPPPVKVIPYGGPPPRGLTLSPSPYPRKASTGSLGSNSSPASPPASNHSAASVRRLTHYPSNNSLHSDSSSPVPPPSSRGSPRHTPTPRVNGTASSNLVAMRKWSASQELSCPPNNHTNKLYRSIPNCEDSQSHTMVAPIVCEKITEEEGVIRMFLRGRPLTMHVPTSQLSDYSLERVNHPPAQRLKLEWVYGYRGRDCRSNLFLLPTGEVVYFVAAVVVLYNVEDQIQRHYLGHTDDVNLTVHPNKLLVATGQVTGHDRRERQAHVRIWDSVSLHTLHILGQCAEFDRAVCCLAFSKLDGGSTICVVDEATEHTISLWEWQRGERGHRVTETKSSTETVLAAEFHPMDKHCLITLGKGHVHFWDTEGGTLAKKLGLFEKFDKPRYVLCMAFTELGELLTGDSNGNILVWPRGSNRVSRTLYGAHDGGVFSICPMKDGTYVTGGGKDRRIVEWDHGLNATGREARLPESAGGVRTLTQGKGSLLLVGTTKNCILQGTLLLNFSTVIQGHTEEVWALAVHPTQQQFLSGGVDQWLHLWDTMSHSVVWSKDLGEPARSACFSPDGSHIAVATARGYWAVLDAATRQVYASCVDGSEPIECIAFSPDGKFLAFGSHDNNIYVYQVSDDGTKFSRIGRCTDGGSTICVVDEATEHTISLWEWQRGERGHRVTETKSSTETVLAAEFHPMDKHCLITLGKGHVHFWDTEGGTLAKKLGLFEKFDKPRYVLCMAFTELGELLTGDSNGNILVWPRGSNRVSRTLYGAHDGGVFSICPMKDGTYVTGGGKDRRIVEWDHGLNATGREARLPESAGGVRTLTQGKGSLLLVGTTKNCILQGTLLLNFSTVIQGHTEEVWALAVHPTQQQFLSGGVDQWLHLWDTMSHSVVWSKDLGEPARSACFSPDGSHIAVATARGYWAVLDAATRQVYASCVDGSEPIECIAFSPDGKFLAFGSHDNNIYVYQVSDDGTKFSRIGRCTGHSNFITHLDWSEDSTYLQSNSADVELLYWNAGVCRQVSNMSIARDLQWHTQTCTLGFNVFDSKYKRSFGASCQSGVLDVGIWSEGADINASCRSSDKKLLATADDSGRVRLFTFPASQPKRGMCSAFITSTEAIAIMSPTWPSFRITVGSSPSVEGTAQSSKLFCFVYYISLNLNIYKICVKYLSLCFNLDNSNFFNSKTSLIRIFNLVPRISYINNLKSLIRIFLWSLGNTELQATGVDKSNDKRLLLPTSRLTKSKNTRIYIAIINSIYAKQTQTKSKA